MLDYHDIKFFELLEKEVKKRVSEKRFLHIKNVSSTAEWLAKTYEEDTWDAKIAGILHDWDKGLSNDEVKEKVKKYNSKIKVDPWVVENMPQLLHGPTAAAELANLYPQLPHDVLRAIYYHTTATCDMAKLDMIIYVADAIEPTRQYSELEELTGMVGSSSLEALYANVYKYWTCKLIENNKLLHPDTIKIYNHITQYLQ